MPTPRADHDDPATSTVSSHDRAELLARLAAELQQAPGEALTARTMVERTLDLLPGADCASITVRARHNRFVTLGATDDCAALADALQYDLGQGPCLEAGDHVEWYRSGDVATDPRWPVWGPRAAGELGVRSLLSVRLVGETDSLGALTVYARSAGRFGDRSDIDLLLLFATHATIALAAAREVSGLQTAVHSRHVIGMAQGVLMERYDLDSDQAFALLRRYSNALNVKVHDVCEDIAATRRLPVLPD
ncbi:GAF and ANTAR domain-containing protein [Nocardioides iriomotensis]|uniref:ANTAR domain-containing protein n=1 Tax=Nocardioides iriomotensis TaxID=715784 RepID=A0A4Q5IUE4_9ACTN|nr:GAF and ANTAR domain-containing protein [Nocardioides iriomotensis]RYU09534.1 ANTAR domain-containing protein [Nocardioides iriomotensis]